jgi:mannose-6-phosphate isomerase-like protein (cupin superfamily)
MSDGPTTNERASGNIFIRECHIPKRGEVLPLHVHAYDHTMFFMRGRATVKTITGQGVTDEKELNAPADYLVPAGVRHEITALSDDVQFNCVFVHRDAVGTIGIKPIDMKAYW